MTLPRNYTATSPNSIDRFPAREKTEKALIQECASGRQVVEHDRSQIWKRPARNTYTTGPTPLKVVRYPRLQMAWQFPKDDGDVPSRMVPSSQGVIACANGCRSHRVGIPKERWSQPNDGVRRERQCMVCCLWQETEPSGIISSTPKVFLDPWPHTQLCFFNDSDFCCPAECSPPDVDEHVLVQTHVNARLLHDG